MMMALSALRPDASLPEFLAHRARTASLRRLQLDVAAGLGIGASVLLLHDTLPRLLLLSIGVLFGCYGAWGLADRARERLRATQHRIVLAAVETSCALLVALGIVATAAVLYAVWGLALGTWIS